MNPFQTPIGPFSQPEENPEDAWLQEQETGFAPMRPLVTRQPATDEGNDLANAGYTGLMALGLANTLTSQPDRRSEQRLRRAMNTDSMSVNNPANPFGDYTTNVGIGNNFQPTMHTPTQRWGYETGGQTKGLSKFVDGGQNPNKTINYLHQITPGQAGQQEFWQQGINDIPHPLRAGQTLTYGQLQELLRGSQRKAILDEYAKQRRLPSTPSAEDYLQDQFTQGHTRFMQRAYQDPTKYAFPQAADDARQQALRPIVEQNSSQIQPDNPFQVTNPRIRQQMYAKMGPTNSGYVAPGASQARRSYAEGGEYQLSPWEVQELRAKEYVVEELD